MSWRPADLDNAFIPFAKGIGNNTGFTDPVFRERMKEKHGCFPEDDIVLASEEWNERVYSGTAHSWEQLELLKQHWDGPIVLKGIQVSTFSDCR
jgi:lactate 2-monooxygenase